MNKLSGIYFIQNIVNCKLYLGSSKNIEKRIKQHFKKLRSNNHINIKLQNSYNKYGESNFIVDYIEVPPEFLLEIEQKFLDALDFNYNFNINRHSSGGDNLTFNPQKNKIIEKISKSSLGRSFSQEHKDKIRESISGNNHYNYGGSLSQEHKNKISKALSGENNPMYGKKHYEESIQKMKDSLSEINRNVCKGENHYLYNKNLPQETKNKISIAISGENNPRYGKNLPQETKEKISKKLSGRKKSPLSEFKRKIKFSKKVISLSNKICFYSIKDALTYLGISYNTFKKKYVLNQEGIYEEKISN